MRFQLLAPFLLVFAAVVPSGTADSHDVLQPGDFFESNDPCTLGFVLDGQGPQAGNVYFVTGLLCVTGVGDTLSSPGFENFGTVVYETPNVANTYRWSLIQVHEEFEDDVSAEVAGLPGVPSGVAEPQETSRFNDVDFVGHTFVFESVAEAHARSGIFWDDTPDSFMSVAPAVADGDVGAPMVYESGEALGIITRLTVECCADPIGYRVHGPTVFGIIADLADAGYPVALRTVS